MPPPKEKKSKIFIQFVVIIVQGSLLPNKYLQYKIQLILNRDQPELEASQKSDVENWHLILISSQSRFQK